MPLSDAARAFLALFSLCTGQTFRAHVSYLVAQEAEHAVLIGITEEEIRLVVAYVRHDLNRNQRTVLNDSSLLWRNLARDQWGRFDELLTLAKHALKRGDIRLPRKAVDQPVAAPENIVEIPVSVPNMAKSVTEMIFKRA